MTELEEAKNVRYAKEGEVSILRKGIEKVYYYLSAVAVLHDIKPPRLRKTMLRRLPVSSRRKPKRKPHSSRYGRRCARS